MMVTSELLGVQGPLEMVQRKTYVPFIKPVMVVFGKITDVMEAVFGPLIWVQFPVPFTGVFAAMVTTVPQTSCVGPAIAVVGAA